MIQSLKMCSKCQEPFPRDADHFDRASRQRDGLRPDCKACRKETRPAEYARTRERRLAQSKVWARENPEARKVIEARYRKRATDKTRARVQRWRQENPDAVREQQRRAYQAHGAANAALRRARKRGVRNERIDPAVVYEQSAGVCYLCERPVGLDEFHMDHYIPLTLGGSHTYDNLAATHAACNKRKGSKLPWQLNSHIFQT